MYKLELGVSIDCFGLKWLDGGKYQITQKHEFVDEMTKAMNKNGVATMELSTAGGWNLKEEEENFPAVKEYVKIIKRNGVRLNSVHLPFSLPFWEFDSPNEEARKSAVERAKWAISMFEEGEPKYFVIHPGKIGSDDPEERKMLLEQLRKSMQELCDSTTATICIENMTGDSVVNKTSEALWLLERVPKLMMVIDINHPFIETPEYFIEKIGDRVKCLHVSDRDEIKERHNLPGDGILNWNNIIGALEKIGYKNEFTYEISIASRKTPLSEVRKNYEKLFENYNASK
jgi:sugar phosphate isomerase/epimerase